MKRPDEGRVDLVESYRRLTAIYRDLLLRDDDHELLERIADNIFLLIPCDTLLLARLDRAVGVLVPTLVRGSEADKILELRPRLGEGLIGWAAEHAQAVLTNDAAADPRAGHVAGTSQGGDEAIISVPLVARGTVLGAISLYREGQGNMFSADEFEIAQQFADAVTIALVNVQTRADLELLASTDELTGILNRRGFVAAARAILERTDQPLTLLLIDLDDFKRVNDDYGHDVGDELLQQVARQLGVLARLGDVVARLGGDEFALLLPDTGELEARVVAARVDEALRQVPYIGPHGMVRVPASVGYASGVIQETELDELLARADDQMYSAKRVRTERRRAQRGES